MTRCARSMRSWFTFRPGLVAFVAGLGLTLGIIAAVRPELVMPGAAASSRPAHAGFGCTTDDPYGPGGDRGEGGADEDPTGPGHAHSFGTRGDIYIPSNPAYCQRISSIYVYTVTGTGANSYGSFEVGMLDGWSQCTYDGTKGVYFANPVPFWWAHNPGHSRFLCGTLVGTALNGGGYNNFRTADVDQDNYWTMFLDGTQVTGGAHMTFEHGFNLWGTERGDVQDVCKAEAKNLDEYHSGDGWTSWDNISEKDPFGGDLDVDPDCHYHRDSANHGEMLVGN